MEILLSVLYVCLLTVLSEARVTSKEGPCFTFRGDSFLHFTPNNFDNNNNVHYSFKFRTTQENGILMYARGTHGDDEALFIRNGKLGYQLFNTSPTGVEGYFGGYFEGDEIVNTDEWTTVHVFRSWRERNQRHRGYRSKTGFMVEDSTGQVSSHLDYRNRTDISILPTIYFGGYRAPLSETVGYFTGMMKDIREEKNSHVFENPSLNYMSKVSLSCGAAPEPN